MTTGVFLFFFASILLGRSMVSSNMVSAFASSGSEKFSTAGGRVAAAGIGGSGPVAGNGRPAGGGGATGTARGSPGKGTGSSSGNDPAKGSGTIPLIAGPRRTANAAPIAARNPSASLAASIFLIFLLIFRFFG